MRDKLKHKLAANPADYWIAVEIPPGDVNNIAEAINISQAAGAATDPEHTG
ncbi:hypothetical protein [Mycobacterium lepromatosis]|nr:hypothetical protein [Mycobacterium lepromatosis]